MDQPIEEQTPHLAPVVEIPVEQAPVSEEHPATELPVSEELPATEHPASEEIPSQTTPLSLKETVEQSVAEIAANIFDSDTLIHQLPVDSIVKSVLSKFVSRADFGMKKYGTNLDRKDLNVIDWIQHAQEEHMDAILYLEKLKKEIKDTGIAAQKLLSHLPEVPLSDSTQKIDKSVFKKVSHYFCGLVKK